MKKLTVGILAHVDAGKTTLSEALLYTAGALRTLGRVDHGAMRVSAQSFRTEVEEIDGQISAAVERMNLKNQTHRTIGQIGNIKQDN